MDPVAQGKIFSSSCYGDVDPNREPKWITWSFARGGGPTFPIYKEDWYFSDETSSDIFGPFSTKEQAEESLNRYLDTL